MPQYGVQDIIKFAGAGKPAKFGDAFGQMMQGKVNAGVEAIRQKVAAKLAGLDPTGERGDGPEDDPLRCRMARPHGVFYAPGVGLYIGDSEVHRIRLLE